MEKLNVLGQEYVLVYEDSVSRECLMLGEVDFIKQQIRLLNGMHQDLLQKTLWHEILHIILNQLGFVDESDNEHLIDCLATGIHQVLKDNVNTKLTKNVIEGELKVKY